MKDPSDTFSRDGWYSHDNHITSFILEGVKMLWIVNTPVQGIALSMTNTKPPMGLHLAAAL